MGGAVAFAIKKNNRVSTRVFSKHATSALNTQGFFEKNHEIWEIWKGAKAEPFAPYDYGLTVVDFDQLWVASLQGYTSLDTWYGSYNGELKISSSPEYQELKALWDAGRVVGLADEEEDKKFAIIRQESFEETMKALAHFKDERNYSLATAFKLRPPHSWIFEKFGDNEYQDFIRTLLEKGFKFKDKDIEAWRVFLENAELDSGIIHAVLSEKEAEQLQEQTVKLTQPTSSTIRKARL